MSKLTILDAPRHYTMEQASAWAAGVRAAITDDDIANLVSTLRNLAVKHGDTPELRRLLAKLTAEPGQTTKYVEWVEPYSDGSETLYLRMSFADIASARRRVEPRYESDQQAIDDFLVVHWGRVIELAA